MVHDDFDSDWKPSDEPHGTLIFSDEPRPVEATLDVIGKLKELESKIAKMERSTLGA
jgi:hypothetical protein